MDLGIVFQSIFLIALLILLGAIVAKYYVFNDDTKRMYITLITNIVMPSIILSSIFRVEISSQTMKTLVIVFTFFHHHQSNRIVPRVSSNDIF